MTEIDNLCVWERERVREIDDVCVIDRLIDNVCVSEWEREGERDW